MSDFTSYARRGFSYLQNMAANVVLKTKTMDDDANISMLVTPVPAAVYQTDLF